MPFQNCTDCHPKINGWSTGVNQQSQYQCDFLTEARENDWRNIEWFVDGVKVDASMDERISIGNYNQTGENIS